MIWTLMRRRSRRGRKENAHPAAGAACSTRRRPRREIWRWKGADSEQQNSSEKRGSTTSVVVVWRSPAAASGQMRKRMKTRRRGRIRASMRSSSEEGEVAVEVLSEVAVRGQKTVCKFVGKREDPVVSGNPKTMQLVEMVEGASEHPFPTSARARRPPSTRDDPLNMASREVMFSGRRDGRVRCCHGGGGRGWRGDGESPRVRRELL